MSVKDKILFGLVVILIVGGVYVQYSYTLAQEEMAKLRQEQKEHVSEVNVEFREDLRKLNLQFIGRGKHLRQAQKDIIANTDLIAHVTDSLSGMIEDVRFDLADLERSTDRQFTNVNATIEDLEDELNRTKRNIRSMRSDLEQEIQNVKNTISDIENLEVIVKAREKLAKEKS